MKYPIGIQTFDKIINGGYVYVDKTDLVYNLVKEGNVYFLGRPRRFGKSLLVSTLENYFLGNKDLFKGLAIDSLEHEWKKYPVFHLDFNTGNYLNDVYIFEFKLDGYAEMALQQIKHQGYSKEYLTDKRTVHLIGANFSSEEGTIDEWKEETLYIKNNLLK